MNSLLLLLQGRDLFLLQLLQLLLLFHEQHLLPSLGRLPFQVFFALPLLFVRFLNLLLHPPLFFQPLQSLLFGDFFPTGFGFGELLRLLLLFDLFGALFRGTLSFEHCFSFGFFGGEVFLLLSFFGSGLCEFFCSGLSNLR
jgi:hypothetical protein